ncbi:ABC transporter ATP-binding protein [Qingshengfaniella alkalisoli]|uniref:ABC transporter ATP-binding protein n=1 Tax=Qingshengfaniella alkalisoli TaxID=2599296 RepID=A0A5B8I6Y2_9RHOB|nr:ABC transporter ATP-binding protein [Qingshengfaniella alkalisoli]QDY68266.1 ABC transporter ATP-binding protein [Qingshengfaniella alkalisoli]
MPPIVSVQNLDKTYDSGFTALRDVSLNIEEGEILALLGPNGAGKTTMISIICGITSKTGGTVTAGGFDIDQDFRSAREMIGLVPQEIAIDPFEKVLRAVRFSRGLHGCPPDEAYLEKLLRSLSLWDKRDTKIIELSGGMKRRVLIAKALSHQPRILFLDEPTAGVDVELRKDMWDVVRRLKEDGVTIILTTHYIEEAEAIADRVGVINKGQILLVEAKTHLMERLGRKQMEIYLQHPLQTVPDALSKYDLELGEDGETLIYTYDTQAERTGITTLLSDLSNAGVKLSDIQTRKSTLEEIFVDLVREQA